MLRKASAFSEAKPSVMRRRSIKHTSIKSAMEGGRPFPDLIKSKWGKQQQILDGSNDMRGIIVNSTHGMTQRMTPIFELETEDVELR